MKHQPHRKLLEQLQAHVAILCKFSAPDCRVWTAMSNAHPDKDKLERDRKTEFGMLDWLHQDNRRQDRRGHGYINENGLRSIVLQGSMATIRRCVYNLSRPNHTLGLCHFMAHGIAI